MACLPRIQAKLKRLRRRPRSSNPAPDLPQAPSSQPEPSQSLFSHSDTEPTPRLESSESALTQIKFPASNLMELAASPSPPTPATEEDIRGQIWDEAYQDAKKEEPELVQAYETVLSVFYNGGDSSPATNTDMVNLIPQDPEARKAQMKTFVEKGIEKTKRAAEIKKNLNESIKVFNNVQGFVSEAVKADPTAAIAWAGVVTCIGIITNPISESEKNRDGIKHVLQRVEWYWELTKLLLAPDATTEPLVGLRKLIRESITGLYKNLLLFQMQSLCLYKRHWVGVILRDAIKLDDWQGKIDSIKDAESFLREEINSHDSEVVKLQLQSMDKNATYLRGDVQEVKLEIEKQTEKTERIHKNEEDKKCLQDLYSTDPELKKERLEEKKGGLLKGSYDWIFNHPDYQKFHHESESRLLWIKGDPGKGKTMLLCGIIDELKKKKQSNPRPVSYFFCQATDANSRNPTAVLRGLIWMLCQQVPKLTEYVREKYDTTGSKLFEDTTAFEALKSIFSNILKDKSLHDAFIVVDALDECFGEDQMKLIHLIIGSSKTYSAKWIVSSRNWSEIEDMFKHAGDIRVSLELNQDSIAQAVENFIDRKVDHLVDKYGYDDELKDQVLQTLRLKAKNTFLWVSLACQELELEDALDPMQTLDSMPSGLDDLYDRMLEKALQLRGDLVRQILAIATVAYRPISLAELPKFISTGKFRDISHLRSIIGRCGSFLTIQQEVIYFVHQSAQDFLLQKRPDKIFVAGAKNQHMIMFEQSLHSFSALKRDIYDLKSPGILYEEIKRPDHDPLSPLKYSCLYWVGHLRQSDALNSSHSIAITKAILKFIRERYLYWLEALSLQGKIFEGATALQELKRIVNIAAENNSDLREYVEDARRFILSHLSGLEVAPLQVYTSALQFSPTESLIRTLHIKEQSSLIKMKPGVQAHWGHCIQTLQSNKMGRNVSAVRFSRDGKRLVASSDGMVEVWDTASGQYIWSLHHGDSSTKAAFTKDDQTIAKLQNGAIEIWDIRLDSCIQKLRTDYGPVTAMEVSRDGMLLASASYVGKDESLIQIWDSATNECIRTINDDGKIATLSFSNDGQLLASTTSLKTEVKVWCIDDGKCMGTLTGSELDLVAFLEGHLMASACEQTIRIWDWMKGICLQTLHNGHYWVSPMIVSLHCGQHLASASRDRIKVWDDKGTCVHTFKGHGASVQSLDFSPDTQLLASASNDYTIKVWEIPKTTDPDLIESHRNGVSHIEFSLDGKYLVSACFDEVKIWNVVDGFCIRAINCRFATNFIFSPDGRLLLFTSSLDKWKLVQVHGDHIQDICGVHNVGFSSDSQLLALGFTNSGIEIWDASSRRIVQNLRIEASSSYYPFAFVSQNLAVAEATCIGIWDAISGSRIQTLSHGKGANIIATSSDSRLLAVSKGFNIWVWDLIQNTLIYQIDEQAGINPLWYGFWSLTFGSDTKWLGAISNNMLRVLNTETGEEIVQWDEKGISNYNDVYDILGRSGIRTTVSLNGERVVYTGGVYGLSDGGRWITRNGERLILIPAEFASAKVSIWGSSVAFACQTGQVLLMRLG